MPIRTEWLDDDEPILIYSVETPWTVDELYAEVEYGYQLSQDYDRFAIIYDLRQTRNIPKGFLSARRYLLTMHQSNVSVRVLVGANDLVRNLKDILDRIMPQLTDGIEIVPDMQQALDLIRRRHATNLHA